MNWKVLAVLFVIGFAFWYGIAQAVGFAWMCLIMISSGIALIALFYKLIKG